MPTFIAYHPCFFCIVYSFFWRIYLIQSTFVVGFILHLYQRGTRDHERSFDSHPVALVDRFYWGIFQVIVFQIQTPPRYFLTLIRFDLLSCVNRCCQSILTGTISLYPLGPFVWLIKWKGLSTVTATRYLLFVVSRVVGTKQTMDTATKHSRSINDEMTSCRWGLYVQGVDRHHILCDAHSSSNVTPPSIPRRWHSTPIVNCE